MSAIGKKGEDVNYVPGSSRSIIYNMEPSERARIAETHPSNFFTFVFVVALSQSTYQQVEVRKA